MNNLQITSSNLPERFEDVAAFAVIAQGDRFWGCFLLGEGNKSG